MTFKYRYRKQILIILLVLVISIGSITSFIVFRSKDKKITNNKKVLLSKNTVASKETKVKETDNKNEVYYKVDVKGQVNAPGIYELKENSRVIDQTTPNMIQRICRIFERNPLISKEI